MDDETARRMDRLLARGKLSGPESDAILERVLDTLDREERGKVRAMPRRYWAGAALAAAAAVLIGINLPRDPGRVHTPESGDLPGLRVSCEGGELSACPVSGKLVFEVTGKKASGFLSAYAEPIGHEGERVFYYSKEDGSVEVPGESAVRPIGLTKAGRYRVHAVIAERPLTREEVLQQAPARAGGAAIRARLQIEIVVPE